MDQLNIEANGRKFECATMSPSKNPGSASTSSPALRILIEERSSGEGFVVDAPLI